MSTEDTRTTEDSVPVDELVAEVALLRSIAAALKHLGKIRTAAEQRIKDRMGVAETGTIAGVPVVAHRTAERTSVSIPLLRANHPKIVSKCSTTTTVRTFVLIAE